LNRLTRKIHYWLGAIIALPLLVVVVSGILLQLKKQLTWVQPAEQKPAIKALTIGPEQMLQALQQDPELKAQSWDQVERIDIRPKKGLAKLTLESGLEVQIDTSNGKILQKAVRRSDLIEALHDGSFFAGDYTKLGLFLPTAIALLLMLITGMWLWWLPLKVKRAKRKPKLPV
jgi:uncharacterized iron-regulated membrane protein